MVLKQAAGKVRCGGCGNAFNALAYLSESKPDIEARTEPDGSLPELTPDGVETSTDATPQSISAEQSAALLKTLDQLAGEDIRLEDTGIEWRVMDDDDDDGAIDEVLERTPTQVDQFLTQTPTEVESAEIFDDPEQAEVEAVEVFEGADTPATQTSAEELRFDDNTGLPDDFDFDNPPAVAAQPEPAPEPDPVPQPEPENLQVDLALGEPDEWGELLDEVAPGPEQEPEPEIAAAEKADAHADIEAELSAIEDEILLTGDEEESGEAVSVDDQPPDIDTQFGLQAEAMGIDLSGMHSKKEIEAAAGEDDVDEAAPVEESVADEELVGEEMADEEITAAVVETDDESEFPDSTGALEFELERAQSAAMQLEEDLTALEAGDELEDTSIDDDLLAAAFENEKKAAASLSEELLDIDEIEAAAADESDEVAKDTSDDIEDVDDADELDEVAAADEAEEIEEAEEDEIAEEATEIQDLEFEVVEDIDTEEPIADIDGPFDEKIDNLEIRLDDEAGQDDDADKSDDLFVPPPTEEEQTINMQIDQELLSMAVEDKDGFASTIVVEDNSKERDPAEEAAAREKEKELLEKLKDTSTGFETIVMEGDAVRSELEQQALNDELEESGGRKKPAFVLPPEQLPEPPPSSAKKYSMIAGVLVLVLLLAVQLVHQSRTELAKIPAVNNIIGPVYRALGAPISPEWDIAGWTIQKSTGTMRPISAIVDGVPELAEETDVEMVDESSGLVGGDTETLTIYSRIGNTSEGPLPYPLINVELIDRFESTLGSTVLEPGEYLADNFDPRTHVNVGDSFDAVIAIESPSADATGFKLTVCYRSSEGLLRCAIESFK